MENVNLSYLPKNLQEKIKYLKVEFDEDIREDAVKEALADSKNKLEGVIPKKRESSYANANTSGGDEDNGSCTDSSIGDLIHENSHVYSNSNEPSINQTRSMTNSSKTSDAFDRLVANAAAQLSQAISINPNSPNVTDENNCQTNFAKIHNSEDSTSMASFGQISGLSSQEANSLNNSKVVGQNHSHLSHDIIQSEHLRSALAIASGGNNIQATNNVPMSKQISSTSNGSSMDFVCEERVTDKIRKLVNTLKRPKVRPLEENFLDNENSLNLSSIVHDPNCPQPKGATIKMVQGDVLKVPSGLPRNLELALSRYAGLNEKAPAVSCLTTKCTLTPPLTFHKLKQKALKIAYVLLNKLGNTSKHELTLKPRDCIALVYSNNEPMSFIISFYACILASLVPIAIEVPTSRKDASCQSMGFLLSTQKISMILTSEQCYRGLKKGPSGEVLPFPGWPKVTWINCDAQILNGSSKPPKDWQPPERLPPSDPMFTEYSFDNDGHVHGVIHTRQSTLAHCKALSVACAYTEADVMVCVLDMRREVGLWHSVLTSIFNGIHVIFVPYAVMQIDPCSWLKMVTKFQATVAITKSRDLHWAMLYDRDHKSLNLGSLRMILLENGSNPWSHSSCEEFANKFSAQGLLPDIICPAASSPEATTVCLRRPSSNVGNNNPSAKGNISMHALSYSVVRVDSENDRSSLTLQDCGQVLPGTNLVTVRLGPKPIICKTDEVGEICISGDYLPVGYWGLEGTTKSIFYVKPLDDNERPIDETRTFVRTGFVGFPGPSSSGGLIFICGAKSGLIKVEGRHHNANDIIATILAVPPNRIIFRNRIAVFGTTILNEERVVVVGELRNDGSEKAAYHWMSQVIQAIESIHRFSLYCILMVSQHNLPKTPFGGINVHEVKRMLDQGCLSPTVLMMSPHSSIQNLPHVRMPIAMEVGPSAMMVGQMVQGVRLAEANGRAFNQPISQIEIKYLPNILTWRAEHTPDDILFTIYNQKGHEQSKITAGQMHGRVDKIKSLLIHGSIAKSVQLQPGSIVALMFPANAAIELAAAFYACLSLGIIAVIVKAPRFDVASSFGNSSSSPVSSLSAILGLSSSSSKSPSAMSQSRLSLNNSSTEGSLSNMNPASSTTNLSASSSNLSGFAVSGPPPVNQAKFGLVNDLETALSIISHSKALCVLTNSSVIKHLKSKQITSLIPLTQWPHLVDIDEFHRKKSVSTIPFCRNNSEQMIAYMDFNISTTGSLTSIPITHAMINSMCLAQKMQCEFYPTMKVLLSVEPVSGMAMSLYLLMSVYCGHHTLLLPPNLLETNPELWITIVSQEEIRDTFCTYSVIESSLRIIGKQIIQLKQKNLSLSRLRSLVIVAEERPRLQLTSAFIKVFSTIGLNARSVSTSFGCRTNPAVCLQGSTSPDLATVYVDKIALRNDRIKLVEKGTPNSLCLLESGKLLPGIHVVIANPDTLGQCSDSQLGEIWIESHHNAQQICGPFNKISVKGSNNNPAIFGMISLSNSQGSLSDLFSDSNPTGNPSGPSRGEAMQLHQRLPKSGVNTGMGNGDQLKAILATGDTKRTFVRTGFLGFVRRTDLTQADGHAHDALFVVGSLEEAIILRGMRYHPIDIETTVLKAHRKICQSAVFTWSNLLVVVAELMGHEYEALNMIHPIVSRVVEDHQLIVGVVVIVDPGTIPISHQGDKQRILLRDRFVSDQLDPIYVSYNM